MDEQSENDESENAIEDQRRAYDLDQLRYFLLTANAEQRAARRKEQDYNKRELVNQSTDSNRTQLFTLRFANTFNHCPIQTRNDIKKFAVSSISDFSSILLSYRTEQKKTHTLFLIIRYISAYSHLTIMTSAVIIDRLFPNITTLLFFSSFACVLKCTIQYFPECTNDKRKKMVASISSFDIAVGEK